MDLLKRVGQAKVESDTITTYWWIQMHFDTMHTSLQQAD